MALVCFDPTSASCPHCRSDDAMEWPVLGDVRAFFCSSCQGFKVRSDDVSAIAEQHGTGPFGRMAAFSTGDRWLVPE